MQHDHDRVSIKTASRYFWRAQPPHGVWSAGLHWTPDDINAEVNILSGSVRDADDDHNIAGDVHAVLAGLRRAEELGLDATVYSTNDSVVRTIPEYYDTWRKRGWKSAKKKAPDSLEEWHQVYEICQNIDVRWKRRAPDKIDAIDDHREFSRLLEEEDRDFWMHRAIARDPY